MSRRDSTVPLARRPLAVLASLSLASLFLAAPTPGNVGGCGGHGAANMIDPSHVPPGVSADAGGYQAPETAEYAYFDRGMCASFCLRLRECGVLCTAMGNPTMPDGSRCDNNSTDAYVMCMRGQPQQCNDAGICTRAGALNGNLFNGETRCPHTCAGPERNPGSARFTRAFEWDVQACSDAVMQLGCADLVNVPTAPPRECTNVCR